MGIAVDYYFTTGSPWTYLGHRRFAEILARHEVGVNVKPVDFGKIFPASGGLPLKQRAPQRQAYRLVELTRWRDHLGVPINIQPKFFPFAPDASVRAIIAAEMVYGAAVAMDLAYALMQGCWMQERDLGDPATVAAIVHEQHLDPGVLAKATDDAAARYEQYTAEAIERGVFGAPSYVVEGEIFWGQDRLDFLDWRLGR